MGRRKTHEEFVEELKKVQPDLEVLGKYINSITKIKVKDKYGGLLATPYLLLQNKTPTIQSAIDKNKYFINQAKEIHGDKYDYSKVEYINLTTPIDIICTKHGNFSQIPRNHLYNNAGCPSCGINKRIKKRTYSLKTFIKKSNEVHGDKYDYSKIKYKNSQSKIKIICKKHGAFTQTPSSHLSGKGCPKCAIENLKKDQLQFIKQSNEIHDNKFDYSKVNYRTNRTKVCIICPEHGEFWQTPTSHLNSIHGCPECAIAEGHRKLGFSKRKTLEQFVKQSNKIHDNKYNYSKTNYKNFLTKVCIICPEHGEFWQRPSNHLQGNGCPKCNSSKGELKIEKWLKNNNIEYKRQKKFKKCKLKRMLPFDFYLLKQNICIEYDGRQHYKPIDFAGEGAKWAEENLKQQQQNDQVKNDYCKENNIKLIRIPYWDFDNIEEILEKEILK